MRIENRKDIKEQVSSDLDNLSNIYFRINERQDVKKYEILHVIERARQLADDVLEHLDGDKSFSEEVSDDFSVGLVGRSETYPETSSSILADSEEVSIAEDLGLVHDSLTETENIYNTEKEETPEDTKKEQELENGLEYINEDPPSELILAELPALAYSTGKRMPKQKPKLTQEEQNESMDIKHEGKKKKKGLLAFFK